MHVVEVLQDLGYKVVYPMGQSCCGKPVLGMGDRETGRKIAKQNIEACENAGVDGSLTACPTCAETRSHTYHQIFEGDPEWSSRADAFAKKIYEFTSFVANAYEKAGRLKKQTAPGAHKVTYHDSCHMRRGLGIYKVEMKNPDKCCGMAGAFGVKYSEISLPMLEEKIENIKNTGADTIAVACPACMMQIGGGLDKQAPNIKIRHVADILAEALHE